MIRYSKTLLRVIKIAPYFYTTWVNVLFFIVFYIFCKVDIPIVLKMSSLILLIETSIAGIILIFNYANVYIKKYNISKKMLYIGDFFSHVFPLVFVFFNHNRLLKGIPLNNELILKSLFIGIVFKMSYYLIMGNTMYLIPEYKLLFISMGSTCITFLIICIYIYGRRNF